MLFLLSLATNEVLLGATYERMGWPTVNSLYVTYLWSLITVDDDPCIFGLIGGNWTNYGPITFIIQCYGICPQDNIYELDGLAMLMQDFWSYLGVYSNRSFRFLS